MISSIDNINNVNGGTIGSGFQRVWYNAVIQRGSSGTAMLQITFNAVVSSASPELPRRLAFSSREDAPALPAAVGVAGRLHAG